MQLWTGSCIQPEYLFTKIIIICRVDGTAWTATTAKIIMKWFCTANESLMDINPGLGCHRIPCEFMDAHFANGQCENTRN